MNFICSQNLYTIHNNNNDNEVIQDLKLRNVIFAEQLQSYYQQQEQLKLLNNINIMPSAFKPVDCGTLALSLQLSTTSLLNNISSPFIFTINDSNNNNNSNDNNNIILNNYTIDKNQLITKNDHHQVPISNTTTNSLPTYYQVTRNRHGRPYNPGRPLEMVDREKILSLFQQGYKISHIAKIIGVTHSCVSKIMTRYKKTGSINPRSPQIKKYLKISDNLPIAIPVTRILNSPSYSQTSSSSSSSSLSSSSSSSCSSVTSLEVDVISNYDILPKPVAIKNTFNVDRFMQ